MNSYVKEQQSAFLLYEVFYAQITQQIHLANTQLLSHVSFISCIVWELQPRS